MRDASQRPVIFGVAVRQRPAPEGLCQTPELGGRQAAGMSRSMCRALALGPLGCLLPASDTPGRYADPLGHLLRAQATSPQVSGTLATTRQLFARSIWSHVPYYRTS
jgi:hypothetical protein